jgi:hypothetical protein
MNNIHEIEVDSFKSMLHVNLQPDSPCEVAKQTVSEFCRSTLCLCPATSTSTRSSGLVSILTRPTITVRDLPWASTASTWLPVCMSDKYDVLPSAIATYACTGPCFHTPEEYLNKLSTYWLLTTAPWNYTIDFSNLPTCFNLVITSWSAQLTLEEHTAFTRNGWCAALLLCIHSECTKKRAVSYDPTCTDVPSHVSNLFLTA